MCVCAGYCKTHTCHGSISSKTSKDESIIIEFDHVDIT